MTTKIEINVLCDGRDCLKRLYIGQNILERHGIIVANGWQTVLVKTGKEHYCPECYPIAKAKLEEQKHDRQDRT